MLLKYFIPTLTTPIFSLFIPFKPSLTPKEKRLHFSGFCHKSHMGTIKTILFSFFFAGIFISRPTTARFIHLSGKTEMKFYVSGPPSSSIASIYSSSSLVPSPSPVAENSESGGQAVHAENHHHSSIAGGGVIIGGLLTTVFATVYCYIRVTRKRDGEKY